MTTMKINFSISMGDSPESWRFLLNKYIVRGLSVLVHNIWGTIL